MEAEVQSKAYEMAYHLTPDLEESEVKSRAGELELLVSAAGGSVMLSKEPVRKHLSYPLAHKHEAYFGWLHFAAAPEALEKIGSQMKLQSSVLRYLVITKPEEGSVLTHGVSERRRGRPHEAKREEEVKKAEAVSPEKIETELEKALEDIK